jgi:hypothetical protein
MSHDRVCQRKQRFAAGVSFSAGYGLSEIQVRGRFLHGNIFSGARRMDDDPGSHVEKDGFGHALSANFIWFQKAVAAEGLDTGGIHKQQVSLNAR